MPQQMTPGQARVVDPVLTNHAVGYREPDFVGHELFPYVDVNVHGGKVVDFGDYVTETVATLRAPGADAAEIHLKYGSKSFALETHGLDAVVPREIWNDAENTPNIKIAARAVERALKPVNRNLELAQAAVARNAANYAAGHKVVLAGVTQWSDAVNSDPVGDIATAVNAIELDSGGTDIVVLIPSDVMSALRVNGQIKDSIKYSERAIVTPELLVKQGIVKQLRDGLKVLASGDLSKSLTVHAHRFSGKAMERIASLGGRAELIQG